MQCKGNRESCSLISTPDCILAHIQIKHVHYLMLDRLCFWSKNGNREQSLVMYLEVKSESDNLIARVSTQILTISGVYCTCLLSPLWVPTVISFTPRSHLLSPFVM